MKRPSLKLNFISIFLVVGIVVLLLLTVHCNIAQNEKNAQLRRLNSDLDAAVNEGIRLQIQIDQRSDFFSVEEYATKNLGMRRLENYQIQYIQYDVTGNVELLNREEDEDFLGRVSKAFSVIADLFGG